MRLIHKILTAVAALVVGVSAMAAPIVLHGVKVQDSAVVGGATLQLNGVGTRYKGPFKVYVGDLYTSKKVHSLEELIAAPGPKRLTMTFLREMDAGSLGKLLTRGVEDNIGKAAMSKLVPGLIRMGEIFASIKVLAPGEVITMDWIPGTGLVITAKGKTQGDPFPAPEFYHAMMSIWFGSSPADHLLKDAMLDIK